MVSINAENIVDTGENESMEDDRAQEVVNETYSWLVFDEFGRADLHAAKTIGVSPLPTKAMREQIDAWLHAAPSL